jgi:nucleoid-associated protein YgaU
VKGDSLWKIAVRAYGDGYKWVSIAKANKLVNPNLIHSGNVLTLPR